MRRIALCFLAGALLLAAAAPAPASAAFGLKGLSFAFEEENGDPAVQAGTHPFAFTNTLEVNTTTDPIFGEVPDDAIKDLRIDLPAGFAGNPTAVPPCSSTDFSDITEETPFSACANGSAVGIAVIRAGIGFSAPGVRAYPVYNLAPSPGTVAKLGFVVLTQPVTITLGLNPNPPYNVFAKLDDIPQPVRFYGSAVTVWGNPASPAHNAQRGSCSYTEAADSCPVSLDEKPFLVMPRSCTGPLAGSFEADSWGQPQTLLRYPTQWTYGMGGCTALGLAPTIHSVPTARATGAASGLTFELDVKDEGLTSTTSPAGSDIKKAVVTLPEGVTINPGVAEGLATCSEADLARETAFSEPGEGCPQASKLGEVEVETPLLEGKLLKGQVFAATQDENPFHTMIALYMVIKNPELGILVKLPGKVEADPKTGQLITTFGEAPYEVPQFPFSHLSFRFREGARAPLITPSTCGAFQTKALLTPWANPESPLTATATFTIDQGCPAAGVPPFHPGFQAGSLSNAAGSYSPFYMRLTRADGEQDMTRFDAILPPGVTGKLAGIARCSEAAIAAAKGKSGREELAFPSCPAASKIGRTLAGAGVGSALTWVPGSLYLAGPFGGDPLSVVAITPAVAGPFDAGTVVVREALTLNPETAEVQVDGAASEPIPHILKGIPLKLRDLRIYADRPEFTLNPTSCEEESASATLFGSFLDPLSSADDVPVSLADRYQAASCASLAFKPKLSLTLKGGTKRGDHPALRATLTYPPGSGYANTAQAAVTLPHSAFLEQAHIRTICTRVQFAAKACPKGSIYGHARAFTPLLEEPLEGPVYLRANGGERNLPDLVAALRGIVDIDLVGYIDSTHARIRTRFLHAPDAPVSKFVLDMQGGAKGLIVNSRNLCPHRATAIAELGAHNGKQLDLRPEVKATGCAKARSERHRR